MIDAFYDAMTLFMLITTLGFVLWILRAGWRGLRDELRRRRRQAFRNLPGSRYWRGLDMPRDWK